MPIWALAGVAATIVASKAKALDHRVSLFMDIRSCEGCPAEDPKGAKATRAGDPGVRPPSSRLLMRQSWPSPRASLQTLHARKSAMSHDHTFTISGLVVNS